MSYQIQLDDQIVPDAASFLQVNDLRVGIVPASSLPSASAYLPQFTVEGTEPIHLWLLVEVQEELGQVRVVRGLEGRYVMAQATLTPTEEYDIPLSAFTLLPDQVLFFLCHGTEAIASTLNSAEQAPQPSLGDRVLNLGQWFQNQLDEVAQQWGWTLLNSLTPAVQMRSPTQELDNILSELEPQGLTIPDHSHSGYTDLQVASVSLRLYVLVWSLTDSASPEWCLIVFLGPSSDTPMPSGLTLRMYDADSLLAEQTHAAQSEATYLYTQVFGSWNETFTLEIVPPRGDTLTLPAFGFQAEPDAL